MVANLLSESGELVEVLEVEEGTTFIDRDGKLYMLDENAPEENSFVKVSGVRVVGRG